MRPFNRSEADVIVRQLLVHYKIGVYSYSRSSCGRARRMLREVKIPKPTTVDRFGVCLHEINHIVGKRSPFSFVNEFYCDLYALNIIEQLEWDTEDWIKRMRWHVLNCIAKAHNRGLDHKNINSDIRTFFDDINFASWSGWKVYVGYSFYKSSDPKQIEKRKIAKPNYFTINRRA